MCDRYRCLIHHGRFYPVQKKECTFDEFNFSVSAFLQVSSYIETLGKTVLSSEYYRYTKAHPVWLAGSG